jgi:hypothetical protein
MLRYPGLPLDPAWVPLLSEWRASASENDALPIDEVLYRSGYADEARGRLCAAAARGEQFAAEALFFVPQPGTNRPKPRVDAPTIAAFRSLAERRPVGWVGVALGRYAVAIRDFVTAQALSQSIVATADQTAAAVVDQWVPVLYYEFGNQYAIEELHRIVGGEYPASRFGIAAEAARRLLIEARTQYNQRSRPSTAHQGG